MPTYRYIKMQMDEFYTYGSLGVTNGESLYPGIHEVKVLSGSTNLALNCTITAPNLIRENSYLPAKATSGDITTITDCWIFGTQTFMNSLAVTARYGVLDLGSSKAFDKITIYMLRNPAYTGAVPVKAISFYGSNDNVKFDYIGELYVDTLQNTETIVSYDVALSVITTKIPIASSNAFLDNVNKPLMVDGITTGSSFAYSTASDTHVVKVDCGVVTDVTKYRVYAGTQNADSAPINWTFRGSNTGGDDDSEWATLYTATNIPHSGYMWTYDPYKEHTFAKASFRYYSWKFTGCSAIGTAYHGYIEIDEVVLYNTQGVVYSYLGQASNTDLYQLSSGSWVKVGTGVPTQAMFDAAAVSSLVLPTVTQLQNLATIAGSDVKLLWQMSKAPYLNKNLKITANTISPPTPVTDYKVNLTVVAKQTATPSGTLTEKFIPQDQFVYAKNDLSLATYAYIDWIHVNDGTTGNISGNGKLSFIVSLDQGVTWYAYNGTEWIRILDTNSALDGSVINNMFVPSTDAMARIMSQGMSQTVFNAAPWQAFTIDSGYNKIRFGYGLSQQASTDVAFNDNIKYQGTAQGEWVFAINGTDYKAKANNTLLTIDWLTPLNGKRVKVNF